MPKLTDEGTLTAGRPGVYALPAAAWTDRSVPLGQYCRRSPLVFSFEPRGHGLWGSQKYTCTPVSIEQRAWSVISATIPRQRAPQLGG